MASTSGENNKQLHLNYMLDEINKNTRITDINDYYDFTNDKRGVALLFNNEFKDIEDLEREGSVKDCADLKTVLEELKFEVRVFKDLRLNQMRKELYEFSKVDQSNNDCLLVAVMTHGEHEGQIRSADLKYFHTEELWKNFVGSNCESLVGKPKLFFIQACRGGIIDIGVSLTERNTIEEDAVTKKGILIPNFADIMIMYSTSEGRISYRDSSGSWFIQSLCGELKSNSQDDLMRILMRVSRKVAVDYEGYVLNKLFKRKQMPSIVSNLTKLVYFSTFGQNFDPTSQVSSDSFEEINDIDLR